MDIQVRNLSVSIPTNRSWTRQAKFYNFIKDEPCKNISDHSLEKALLYPVSADLPPNSLTVILGGSGAGKTTFLDAVASQFAGSHKRHGTPCSGTVTYGRGASARDVKHAYVAQQDMLIPTLTVRETLTYAAHLRLPARTSKSEMKLVVEGVIADLGLQDCADTKIGSEKSRGCSGGERRLVSIGVQLLSTPPVLFLDEPTTGLDAATALHLVHLLREWSRKGHTVVMTAHQPRSEIWDLFDNVMVLTDGASVYFGLVQDCLSWFQSLELVLPSFTNPADFILDITSIDSRSMTRECRSRDQVNRIKEAWLNESLKRFPLQLDPGTTKEAPAITPFTQKMKNAAIDLICQIIVLTKRTAKVTLRDPLGLLASMIEAIVMGLVIGYIFRNLGSDEAGIKSRQGCLYVAASLQGYLILMFETYRVSLDIPYYEREVSDGCTSPIAFILSRRLARIGMEDLPVPLIFSTLVSFLAGLRHDDGRFVIFIIITVLAHYAAVTFATLCVVIHRDFAVASMIANLTYILQINAAGFLIIIPKIPVYVRWMRWISCMFFTFSAYASNEFTGSVYSCPFPGGLSDPRCEQYTGAYVIDSLGFPSNWTIRPIIFLVLFNTAFTISAILGLIYWKGHHVTPRCRPAVHNYNAMANDETSGPSIVLQQAGARSITVEIQGVTLNVKKVIAMYPSKRICKPILQPVYAQFQPGILNVIIGPSGSGKTSLIDVIASRLKNNISSRYIQSGEILLNGKLPSPKVLKSICSYVSQDDNSLLPTLTVRETLYYAAALRLPSALSLGKKHRRADTVLLELGLKKCADTLVGNDLTKGISGGERRRVSIAIQILTNPRILLVDEPTSGLDAFTASSIIELLQRLASEGRTVIMAIHQPRSDIFQRFGTVLLLARGGFPIYFGAAGGMIGYFKDQGYNCPSDTNPADFVLDTISTGIKKRQHSAVDVDTVVQQLHNRFVFNVSKISSSSKRSEVAVIEAASSVRASENTAPEPISVPMDDQIKARTFTSAIPLTHFTEHKAHLAAEFGASVYNQKTYCATFPIVLRRSVLGMWRQPSLMLARVMQPIGTVLLFALFFSPLGHDQSSIQSHIGFFLQLGGLYFVGVISNVSIYPNERDAFYRELADGVYGVSVFLSVYTTIEIPFQVVTSFLFGLLVIFATGLPHTVETYFTSVLVCLTCLSCGESIGIMFNTMFDHTGFAMNLMGIALALASTMCGLLSINMPALFNYFNYLSPLRYAIRSITYVGLHDLAFECEEHQVLRDGSCPITSGNLILEAYKFEDSLSIDLAGMAICIVTYRALAWIVMKIFKS